MMKTVTERAQCQACGRLQATGLVGSWYSQAGGRRDTREADVRLRCYSGSMFATDLYSAVLCNRCARALGI